VRVLALAAALGLAAGLFPNSRAPVSERVTWLDLAPLHQPLEAQGITASSFPSYLNTIGQQHAQRIREGDFDHLIFYALQGSHFTRRPPIEPALSAKTFATNDNRIPTDALARLHDLVDALESPSADPRIAYFRALVLATFPQKADRQAGVEREYVRAMRFLYEKEFGRGRGGADAVAELYRSRGLSTDTAVEAGFVVYTGLGIVKSLQPDRQIRRVLIVGPGLDLAPRTSLLETGPPESYQPWAVIDSLLALGLSHADDLQVVGADINPRVVEHLQRARAAPPVLTLVSGIRESDALALAADYRQYFGSLGRALGDVAVPSRAAPAQRSGHLMKTVTVSGKIAPMLSAAPLDVVIEHLDLPAFDLIVATNILPYFDDVELMLAMSNVNEMLAPGGVFLHNEPRAALGAITDALGLPYEQSRRVVIATARGTAANAVAQPAVLVDSVWLHRKVKK
jgi:hypothetical protein